MQKIIENKSYKIFKCNITVNDDKFAMQNVPFIEKQLLFTSPLFTSPIAPTDIWMTITRAIFNPSRFSTPILYFPKNTITKTK